MASTIFHKTWQYLVTLVWCLGGRVFLQDFRISVFWCWSFFPLLFACFHVIDIGQLVRLSWDWSLCGGRDWCYCGFHFFEILNFLLRHTNAKLIVEHMKDISINLHNTLPSVPNETVKNLSSCGVPYENLIITAHAEVDF